MPLIAFEEHRLRSCSSFASFFFATILRQLTTSTLLQDDYPTAAYIERYKDLYSDYNITTWDQGTDSAPLPKNRLSSTVRPKALLTASAVFFADPACSSFSVLSETDALLKLARRDALFLSHSYP